ncbi:unnamed protein product [Protopolystoma xenopodis]|uniref:Uncharacterized protein n=1 Tax=Protopolystoma xenopodis TaxID=117903 RepID=A0A3S5BDL0_9PLAT|nr:unnamed protein product [Protopolystoma xenopodis]
MLPLSHLGYTGDAIDKSRMFISLLNTDRVAEHSSVEYAPTLCLGVSWVRNRFLRRPVEGSIPVYRIDATQVLSITSLPQDSSAMGSADQHSDIWMRMVVAPAVRIVYEAFGNSYHKYDVPELPNLDEITKLMAISCPLEPEPVQEFSPNVYSSPLVCDSCGGRVFVDPAQWLLHIKSKRHKRRTDAIRKQTRK